MNKVTLIGRLGKDPENKVTNSGKTLCTFSIATSEKYKDSSGNKQESTEWHNITAWGKLAEICTQYLKKGSLVAVEGKITYDTYEKEGKKLTSTKIVISNMEMLGSKQEANGNRTNTENVDNNEPELPF